MGSSSRRAGRGARLDIFASVVEISPRQVRRPARSGTARLGRQQPRYRVSVARTAGILARGPWEPGQVDVSWRPDPYEPSQTAIDAADVALDALRERGSPSHDGLAARLADYDVRQGRLALELQPARWALRLIAAGAAMSLSVLCVVRASDGRWLAGRRADWLASWAGRWAL